MQLSVINIEFLKRIHNIKIKKKFGSCSYINRGNSVYNYLSSSPMKKSKNDLIFKENLREMILDDQLSQIILNKPKKKNIKK